MIPKRRTLAIVSSISGLGRASSGPPHWEATVFPRFMELSTPEELLSGAGNKGTRQLKLAARSLSVSGTPGFAEGAGAIVEADGNILVAPNGYPVYASVHMNKSYFDTAKKNLIVNGGYTSQPPDSYFDLGAAVFKATWLRLDPEQKPPTRGLYHTSSCADSDRVENQEQLHRRPQRPVRHGDSRAGRPARRRLYGKPPRVPLGNFLSTISTLPGPMTTCSPRPGATRKITRSMGRTRPTPRSINQIRLKPDSLTFRHN